MTGTIRLKVARIREAGVPFDPPCEEGTCGLCRRPYFEGEPAHTEIRF